MCLDAGVISGWQGTTWDLRDVDLPVAPSDVLVFFPIAELSTLRRLSMPASARAIMATPPLADFSEPGIKLLGLPTIYRWKRTDHAVAAGGYHQFDTGD